MHEESPGEVQRGQMVMVMFSAAPGRLSNSLHLSAGETTSLACVAVMQFPNTFGSLVLLSTTLRSEN